MNVAHARLLPGLILASLAFGCGESVVEVTPAADESDVDLGQRPDTHVGVANVDVTARQTDAGRAPEPGDVASVPGEETVSADGAPLDPDVEDEAVTEGVPDYQSFILVARTNVAGAPAGTFNVPTGHLFTGEDIQLNQGRDVVFRITSAPDDKQYLWFGALQGDTGVGQISYSSGTGAFMRQPSLNDNGLVIFELSYAAPDGLYSFDGATGVGGFFSAEPLGATSRDGVTVTSSGLVGFRASLGAGKAHALLQGGQISYLAKDQNLDPSSPYSFLFTPDTNDQGWMASKVRYGPGTDDSAPDEVRVWRPDGSSFVIASDKDADPASLFQDLDPTSVSLNSAGQVSFAATLTSGERAVLRADTEGYELVATEGTAGIVEVEYFSPDLNEFGLVVFRAYDAAGRAIWVSDGQTVSRVIGEHDLVSTDLGEGRIDQAQADYPVFGGGPGINSRGDIAFNAGLTAPDNPQEEWGTGVFVGVAVAP